MLKRQKKETQMYLLLVNHYKTIEICMSIPKYCEINRGGFIQKITFIIAQILPLSQKHARNLHFGGASQGGGGGGRRPPSKNIRFRLSTKVANH